MSAAPKDISAAMRKIHQYTIMSAPTMAQVAAIEAIEQGEELRRRDAAGIRSAAALDRERLQQLRPEDVRAAGRVLCFPVDRDQRHERRRVRQSICCKKNTWPSCRARPLARAARVSCAARMPRPTKRSKRRCAAWNVLCDGTAKASKIPLIVGHRDASTTIETTMDYEALSGWKFMPNF